MYIIIGQGAAGTSAAIRLRELDPDAAITMISDENDYFYSRIDLPDIIAGKYDSGCSTLRSSAEFIAKRITCRLGETVSKLLPADKCVELSSGERLSYTKLLLATGSKTVIPLMEGVQAKGIHSVWTLAQARGLMAEIRQAGHAVVVGAGLIGLKTALALRARGLDVTIIESMPRVMPRQLDITGSDLIFERLIGKGIKLMLGTKVDGFTVMNDAVHGVKVNSRILPCDLAVVAVGVKPNVELAVNGGIAVKHGIIVNEYLKTSCPDIYAAGDAAEVTDVLTGNTVVPAIWPVAVEQGAIAAANMVENDSLLYTGSIAMNSVEIAGLAMISVGDIEGSPGDEVQTVRSCGSYKKVVIRDGAVRGELFMGDIRQAGVVANLIRQKTVFPRNLLTKSFSFADLLIV